MRAIDVIRHKRDGGTLQPDEIAFMVDGAVSGRVPDYQLSAWLMAIVLRGMDPQETAGLTAAMAASGDRARWDDLPGATIDKHSTGGVGDKTSLVVAPLAAACGVVVPMMAGRGLGDTGGTVDKLESLPGFRTVLSPDAMRRQLAEVGCFIIGQTERIAPADRVLYALRDVTGTVESIPLITASILSKKLAEGLDGLVLDVKAGSGAFMKTEADARRLAESLLVTGRASGLRMRVLLSDMSVPLGRTVGNALEVGECLDVLAGHGPADVAELSIALVARMIVLAHGAPDVPAATVIARRALDSGAALARCQRMIEMQGGDPRVVDRRDLLPVAPLTTDVPASSAGFVQSIHAGLIGRAAVMVGAGRSRLGEAIDPGAGISLMVKPGDRVEAGMPVLRLHASAQARIDDALPLVRQSIMIGDTPLQPTPLVIAEIDRVGAAD